MGRISEEEFKTKHELTDAEMELIKLLLKIFKGKIIKVLDKPFK